MQTIKIIATQKNKEGEKLSIDFVASLSDTTKSKVIGTMLNEIFEFQKVASKNRTSRFMTNEVTDIKLQIGSFEFDTEKIAESDSTVLKVFRAKMKLRNTPQGQKAFATLVYDTINYMCRKQYEITFEELIERLDEEILTSQIVKDFAMLQHELN